MIKQIGEKWRGFWRMASNVALSMDADPLEDIHGRIRRLEAAVFQSEVGSEPGAASQSGMPMFGSEFPSTAKESDLNQPGVAKA